MDNESHDSTVSTASVVGDDLPPILPENIPEVIISPEIDLQETAPDGNAVPTVAEQPKAIVEAIPFSTPGGILTRVIPPTDDDEVPTYKTYTSCRTLTTAVASAHLPENELKVLMGPVLKRNTFDLESIRPEEPCSLDVGKFIPSLSEIGLRTSPGIVDFRRTIYGTTKGIVRTTRNVGMQLKRCNKKYAVTYSPAWGEQKLTPAPGFQPFFGIVTDATVLKHQQQLTSPFDDVPRPAPDTTALASRLAELIEHPVNCVRFLMRLAAIAIEARFATIKGDTTCTLNLTGVAPPFVNITSWPRWLSIVLDDKSDTCYIPWTPPRQRTTDRDSKYMLVLAMAASTSITVGREGNRSAPLIWPELPHTIMLGNVSERISHNTIIKFDAAFIWQVCIAWAARFSTVELFLEMAEIYSTLFWEIGECSAVGLSRHVELALPRADMRGFALSPFLEDSKNLVSLRLADYNADSPKMMFESAVKAQLLSFIRHYCQYPLLDAAIEKELLETEEARMDAMSLITAPSWDHRAPIWGVVQSVLSGFGIPGYLGRIFSTLSVSCSTQHYAREVQKYVLQRTTSWDVVGLLPSLPADLVVFNWLQPALSGIQLQARQSYLFSDFKDKTGGLRATLRCIGELSGVEGLAVIAARDSHDTRCCRYPLVLFDTRGFPRDFQDGKFTLPDGSTFTRGFRLKNRDVARIANDDSHDRYNLRWFMVDIKMAGELRVKPIEGVLADFPSPGDQRDRVHTLTRELRSLRNATTRMTQRLLGVQLPNPRLGDTFCEESDGERESNHSYDVTSFKNRKIENNYHSHRSVASSSDSDSSQGDNIFKKVKGFKNSSKEASGGAISVTYFVDRMVNTDLASEAAQLVVPATAECCSQLDAVSRGDECITWCASLIRSVARVERYEFNIPPRPGAAVTLPAVSALEMDIIQKFRPLVLFQVSPQSRMRFCQCISELLGKIAIAIPPPHIATPFYKLANGMQSAARCFQIAPSLDPPTEADSPNPAPSTLTQWWGLLNSTADLYASGMSELIAPVPGVPISVKGSVAEQRAKTKDIVQALNEAVSLASAEIYKGKCYDWIGCALRNINTSRSTPEITDPRLREIIRGQLLDAQLAIETVLKARTAAREQLVGFYTAVDDEESQHDSVATAPSCAPPSRFRPRTPSPDSDGPNTAAAVRGGSNFHNSNNSALQNKEPSTSKSGDVANQRGDRKYKKRESGTESQNDSSIMESATIEKDFRVTASFSQQSRTPYVKNHYRRLLQSNEWFGTIVKPGEQSQNMEEVIKKKHLPFKKRSEKKSSSLESESELRHPDPCMVSWEKVSQQALILRYLIRGCPCELVKTYGGVWTDHLGNKRPCAQMASLGLAKTWFHSLDSLQRAHFLIERHPAVAGVEHFKEIVNVNLPSEAPTFQMQLWDERHNWFASRLIDIDPSSDDYLKLCFEALRKFHPELCDRKDDFKELKLHGGTPIVLTAKIVLEVYPEAVPLIEILHNVSPNSDEFEVATSAFTLCSMNPVLFAEMIAQNWFLEPLENWHKVYKNVLTRAKRSNTFGNIRGPIVHMLRKFLNVTIRREGEADISVELQNRIYSATPKTWLMPRPEDAVAKGGGKNIYLKNFCEQARENARIVIASIASRETKDTIDTFWSKRAVLAAGGASSLIKKIDTKDLDPRVTQNDRFSKKLTVEYLEDNYLRQVLKSAPCNLANFFTKEEPGKKLRALYSSTDNSMFLSTFASAHHEQHMWKIPGVMVRQTPNDVLTWLAHSEAGIGTPTYNRSNYWLSTDYSDYNSEHTLQEMAIVDLAFADAWRSVTGARHLADRDHMEASCWVASSYSDSWVSWGMRDSTNWNCLELELDSGIKKFYLTNGELISKSFETEEEASEQMGRKIKTWSRIYNGLYSGSRDTARNNTFIHACDIQLSQQLLKEATLQPIQRMVATCGDDEDICFDDPISACLYYNTLEPMGHNLNPVKQLAGADNHEFLQLMWDPNIRVEKPLCALLATLGTGNWYTQLGLWIQSVIGTCIANWWEAHVRGVPLGAARRACASYLDRLMFLAPKFCKGTEWEKEGKKLEWWVYRNQDSFPPLFFDTPGANGRMPRFEAAPEPLKSWPVKATEAYIETQKDMLRLLPKDFSDELRVAIQSDTVGTVPKVWRQREAKSWCARFWPERFSNYSDCIFKTKELIYTQPKSYSELWMTMPSRKLIRDEATVFGRMGVSMFIGRKLGGIKGMASKMPIDQWSKATNVDNIAFRGNNDFFKLQVNIRAVLSQWKVPHPDFHGKTIPKMETDFIYVFMANGAGKSHFCNIIGGAEDLDEIWTDLYGAFRENFEVARPTSSFTSVARVTRDIIDRAWQLSGVLLGQLSPKQISKAISEMGMSNQLYYYDPGRAIRTERLFRRGWDESKVKRRLERADVLYNEAIELQWKRLNYQELIGKIDEVARRRRQILGKNLKETKGLCKMEYVFDKTELVTRQLKIEEEVAAELAAN